MNNVADGFGLSIVQAGDVPIGGTVTSIKSGWGFTCALLTTGAVRCWGGGANGKLGYGNTNAVGNGVGLSIIASGDVPIGAPVQSLAAGGNATCALTTSNTIRCWGWSVALGLNLDNDVGDGFGPSIITAGNLSLGSGTPVALTMATELPGNNQTCVVMSDGAVRCWGNQSSLGYGVDSDGVGSSSITPTIVSRGDVATGTRAATR